MAVITGEADQRGQIMPLSSIIEGVSRSVRFAGLLTPSGCFYDLL